MRLPGVRVISLGRLNANGELDDMPLDMWLAHRAEVIEAMNSNTTRYGDIARYYLTPGIERPVRPGAKITCREAADSFISPDATRQQLERAYALNPAHPLVQIALARFTEDKAEAEFLRQYGLGRIPSSISDCNIATCCCASRRAARPGGAGDSN